MDIVLRVFFFVFFFLHSVLNLSPALGVYQH